MPALRRLALPLLAVACYLTAFFLPTLYLVGQANTNGEHTWMVGAVAFIDGLFAMFDRQYAWIANPLAVVALILLLCRVYLAALPLALAALLFAQHTWAVAGTTISGDEGGVTQYLVTGLGPGFYAWSFSFVILAIAALIPLLPSRTRYARPID